MKKIYALLPLAVLAIQHTAAQYNTPYNYGIKTDTSYQSNWQLNIGGGYGTYYGDMSRYNIGSFSDADKLTRFLNYNKNYIKEPSFHLSVVKRLGLTATGLGLNFNRTLIQGSDRFLSSNGTLQTSNPNFSRSLNFKTDILDAGLSLNLNSFSNGFFSPYLILGAGFSFFDVRGDVFTGPDQNQVYAYNTQQNVNDGIFETKLRDEMTETDTKYPNTVLYTQALLGFSLRFSNNFSLAVETDVKYSGSDYLDDLNGRYKSAYPNQRSQYITRPGSSSSAQAGSRGRNDNVNDFYIQNRIVFRFHIPKYPKRAEMRKASTRFNAPVLYPNNYSLPVDSSAYTAAMWSLNRRDALRADSIKQRRMQDSLDAIRQDVMRTDSLRRTAYTNLKMDSSFTNEVKALRQEIASLRQTIDRNSQQSKKDSIAAQRPTLKDSLNRDLQRLQQKKNKTATENLQQQIYQLRLDSIALAEKYAAKSDTVIKSSQTTTQTVSASGITSDNKNARNREDSLQKVVDSLRNSNTAIRTQPGQATTQPQSVRTVRTIRDTLSPAQVQQYQQQVAGIAYRGRQTGVSNAQLQSKTDSINRLNTSIRTSDSLKSVYYQSQLAKAQQDEEEIKKTERRGLLVKKSDELKEAEADRKEAEEKLQATEVARRRAEQNSRVAAGDTAYITNLQAQLNARQVEIDSLKKAKNPLNIFSDKNKRVRELEQQQKNQQQQIDDANRMLQYYRTTGPTSYYQPDDNEQRRINRLNDRINDLPNQRYTNYQNPPVNVSSPVVVSDNNDERQRMQREIDSLRNQVTRLQQVRQDTARQTSVMLDSTVSRPVIATNTSAAQMAALQRQIAELNSRINAGNTAAIQPQVANTITVGKADATVYFSRGSALLATLQKAKVNALVKKTAKGSSYNLVANSDNTTGNTAANEVLAGKRATAVSVYLKTKGIAAAKITTSVNSVSPEPGSKPDPLARRVDVTIE